MPNRLFIGGSEHGGWADCEDKDLVCVPRPYDPDAPQSVTGDLQLYRLVRLPAQAGQWAGTCAYVLDSLSLADWLRIMRERPPSALGGPCAELASLVDSLRRARFRFDNEQELQAGIYQWLAPVWPVQREVELNANDRIDLLVGAVGIEVKVNGSRAAVIRQLHRYAQHPRISALILVTNRTRHAVPETINGKPVRVVSLVLHGAF